ncbi:MAG TPA: hypothetical protein VEZ50_03005 [Nodosilinea sp.]|nr:hypothetical protein [Nodosilinea sp.]
MKRKSKSFKAKPLITSGLLGLAGLGLLPQMAGATTDLPPIVPDPGLGAALAEEPQSAIAPAPSAQITGPQIVDQGKPQPAWALDGNAAAAASIQLTPASAQEAEVAETEVVEVVEVASPAQLASVPIDEAVPTPEPAALLDPSLATRAPAAAADDANDSALALPLSAVADPEAASASAATPPARTASPDLAAIRAKVAAVQARLEDSRVATAGPEDAATAAAPTPSRPVSQPESFTLAQTTPSAADGAQIRNQLRIEPLTTVAPARTFPPSPNAGIPSGFGANWGDVFFSASLAGADRIRPEADGSLSAGFGLGDSRRAVGVELNYNLLSIRRFGENGGFDAKVHREVYSSDETQVAAAIGLNNFASYGSNTVGNTSSLYGVVTAAHLLQPENAANRLPITGTVGLGGGSFSGEGSDVGVIAGVGLQVHPQFSFNTAWSGVGLNVGASIVPVPTVPLTLNLLYGDVGNNTEAGSVAVLTIGYGFNFGPRF